MRRRSAIPSVRRLCREAQRHLPLDQSAGETPLTRLIPAERIGYIIQAKPGGLIGAILLERLLHNGGCNHIAPSLPKPQIRPDMSRLPSWIFRPLLAIGRDDGPPAQRNAANRQDCIGQKQRSERSSISPIGVPSEVTEKRLNFHLMIFGRERVHPAVTFGFI
jgi:hypothetical protein